MTEQTPKCGTCQHRPRDAWECSHPDCPNRKPITVGIPDDLEDGRRPAHINDQH